MMCAMASASFSSPDDSSGPDIGKDVEHICPTEDFVHR
jgi:hypothetical protein